MAGSVGKGVPGYVTPKVAVGAAVGNEKGEILLVQRADSGVWLYPTGWADVGYSAAEVVVKEVEEETGIEVEVVRLIAVLDGLRIGIEPGSRSTPSSSSAGPIGGELDAHPLECPDVGWFAPDDLPAPLAGAERWGEHDLRRPARRAGRRPLRPGALADLARASRSVPDRLAVRRVVVGATIRAQVAGYTRLVTPPGESEQPGRRAGANGKQPRRPPDATITEVDTVGPELVEAFARLLPQLSSSPRPGRTRSLRSSPPRARCCSWRTTRRGRSSAP